MYDVIKSIMPTINESEVYQNLVDKDVHTVLIEIIKNADDLSTKEKIRELNKEREKYNTQVKDSFSMLIFYKLAVYLIVLGILYPENGQLIRQRINNIITNTAKRTIVLK